VHRDGGGTVEFSFEMTTSRRRLVLALSVIGVLALGYVNQIADAALQVDLEALFLAPIAAVAWVVSRRASLLFAFYVTLVATISCVAASRFPSSQTMLEFVIHGGTFMSAALVVNLLAAAMGRQTHRARSDPLTGTANATIFHEAVDRELARGRRYDHPVSLAFIDIDDFKRLNDEYGHLAGDEVLQSLASLMYEQVRATDIVGRLGGDEFSILFPETGIDEARAVLERLRVRIAEYARAKTWPISASIGGTTVDGTSPEIGANALIKRADSAMYRVKSSGKDRVLIEPYN